MLKRERHESVRVIVQVLGEVCLDRSGPVATACLAHSVAACDLDEAEAEWIVAVLLDD
jgi:hypothetical protein